MYANKLGRFTSPDIVAGEIQNPQSLNKFIYVWNNPLRLTDPTGMIVEWEDSKKKKKKGETDARTSAQRKYENHIEKLINSDDPKKRERGLKLQADYEKLKDSDVTFHVRQQGAKSSSGELSYEGEKGHLYVDLKGDNSAIGSLTAIQKIAHEFKHGTQFLDGELGFFKKQNGEWGAFANDLYDESEAMIAGFEAESITGFQKSDKGVNPVFFNALDAAIPKGQEAVIGVMKNNGKSPYTDYPDRKGSIVVGRFPNTENYYAIPKKP